jgi:predicted DNA-binding protein (MmcQ/YjbR family)
MMTNDPLDRVRELCLALPEAHEVEAWSEPTFRVRGKLFAMYASAHNHHSGGRSSVWIKAAPGESDLLIRRAPERFFAPPYVGVRGWVGVYLDESIDWDELSDMLHDAWRLTAPKRLLAVHADRDRG